MRNYKKSELFQKQKTADLFQNLTKGHGASAQTPKRTQPEKDISDPVQYISLNLETS
jgi:hypothetical protein